MSEPPQNWRPSASRELLRQRAALLAQTRAFFAQRGVLEVDTPMLVNAAVTDVHIESAVVQLAPRSQAYFLHTSPEYAMKRLLAAGSGDIFQICHVVRGAERSRLHNPEFTLLEWYRLGFSMEQLMDEVDALARALLGGACVDYPTEHLSYREAFRRHLDLDPFTADVARLEHIAQALGYRSAGAGDARRDELLELLVSASVGPRLGRGTLTFVHHYPASQAALAQLDAQQPGTALRFELYCEGVELANGFQELTSAAEQHRRFEQDREERRRRRLPAIEVDERLLAALAAGLPACAGVALGFDRLLMLAVGAREIEAVLSFPTESA